MPAALHSPPAPVDNGAGAAIRRTLEAAGTPRKQVIAAGVELLVELIGQAGFASYDDLMGHFLPAELAHRDAELGYVGAGGLTGVGTDCLALKRALDRVFAQLDRYAELERGLDGKAEHLAMMAESARLSALNATISASRLGNDGRVLAAIAMLMRREAGETEEAIQAAAHAVEPTRDATGDVGFDVCLAKIQAEMALYFLDELAQAVDAVTQKLQMLDALRVGGDVEAAHLTDAERFRVLFAQIRSEVDGAAADLRHLAGLADHAAAASAGRRLDRLADRTLRHAA